MFDATIYQLNRGRQSVSPPHFMELADVIYKELREHERLRATSVFGGGGSGVSDMVKNMRSLTKTRRLGMSQSSALTFCVTSTNFAKNYRLWKRNRRFLTSASCWYPMH